MVKKAQILKIEDMSQLDAFCSVIHDSEENIGLIEGSHQKLHVLSRELAELFVLREQALPLDLRHQLAEALKSLKIVLIRTVHSIIKTNALLLELVKLFNHVY